HAPFLALFPPLPRAEQGPLFAIRAEVRERRMKDRSGALDELLRSVPLIDDQAEAGQLLDAEIRRLALATGRFEDLLALLFYRGARAARMSDRRHALLEEAANLAEHQLRAPLRA